MEWFKKILAKTKELWGKWKPVQKLIFVGIAGIVIAGLILMVNMSSSPSMSSVIDAPIRDEAARDRIVTRINQEGVRAFVNAQGIIQVEDDNTAKRMRGILIREDLIPTGIDPWAIFDRESWTITDYERNVNFQRAIRQMVTDHIKAIDDVDDANVSITFPERELFSRDQQPVTASIIIIPKPGSDIAQNKKKIEGIQKLIRLAVVGLEDRNIVITDHTGMMINDFEGMADWDRLSLIERERKIRLDEEAKLASKILATLKYTFTADRVRGIDVRVEMDMSKKTIQTTEHTPFILKPSTPGLSYDDGERQASVTRSYQTSTTSWEGTGFNPEGPPAVEGNTPPVMKDMSNLFGKVTQETRQFNEEINVKTTQEEKSPTVDRITVSVNIDGVWKKKTDAKRNPQIDDSGAIMREYIPMSDDDIRGTIALIQGAIGYNASRSDMVIVRNIPFDRTAQFMEEDTEYFKKKQLQTTVVVALSALTVILISFIIFRAISREIERRKRLEAEERARREEALRQQALMQAESEGMDVSISVEERARMDLMETVSSMAREHPEDVAQLLRTWLSED